MTNTERQRKFRQRNPGYYGRLHARRRAECELMPVAIAVVETHKEMLALPAPVVMVELPGLNIISRQTIVSEPREV